MQDEGLYIAGMSWRFCALRMRQEPSMKKKIKKKIIELKLEVFILESLRAKIKKMIISCIYGK